MTRTGPWSGCALVMAALAMMAMACGSEVTVDDSALAISVARPDGSPPSWTAWTTDGAAPVETGGTSLARGLRCSGRYCDDVSLLGGDAGYGLTASWWTDWFSEEGQNWRVCDSNGFVTGMQCSGSYCDNVSLRCSQLDNGGVRAGCYWTAGISEEGGGRFVAPAGMYVAGASCNGRYCDDMHLLMCRVDEAWPNDDLDGLARRFAPRLRFDQESTTGSGQHSKCFPGDPAEYVARRAQGESAQALCNKDYGSIAEGRVPAFYVASSLGGGAVAIRYWYFFAWQSTCFVNEGDHAADWESMFVLVVDGQLRRVAFHQHSGWYSREPGGYEVVEGTHPVGYIGKNSHGTYHDDGGSGGCLYFEDYRNPGGNDYHMDTWRNVQPLGRWSGAPSWMTCSGCFDGIPHPLDQTGDLSYLGGCGSDGCGKSSIGGLPFIDVAGGDHATITAQHSGRVLDVTGVSGADGAAIMQYGNWRGDNQRWQLESTGDGHVTLRARHSGKCLDVAGASTSAGAPVIQWGCHGGDNQRFRLLGHGDGTFAVQAKHSGQCLDIAGAGMGDGAPLIQWPCTWTANQRFSFAP
jgi:hypothetical protein